MATLHLLGTGASISDPHRTTTMLAFEHERSVIVVDCGGDVVQRLMQADVPLDCIDALIITHEHPDHAGGFPLFMEKIWIAGRRRPIAVHGIAPALAQARRTFASFDTSGWEGLPSIQWTGIAHEENAAVIETDVWKINATPGIHGVPTIGLRVAGAGGGTVAYSCDTEPCDAICALARGCDILVHEATGAFPGHTTAEDAANIAARAVARRLLLVHLPPESLLDAGCLARAQNIFPATEKAQELGSYEF